MKRNNHHLGFTLVELLVVLTLLSLILMVTPRLPTSVSDTLNQRVFFEEIKSQLLLAQDRAMIHGGFSQVSFSPSGKVIFKSVSRQRNHLITEVLVPEGWRIGNYYQFNYLANGHVDDFKTVVFFHESGEKVKLVFQMGSGKFEFK